MEEILLIEPILALYFVFKSILTSIGSNSLKKGVLIEKDENGNSISVKVTIVVAQGADIKKTCINIQEKVKESIESMLDLNVKQVSVRVAKVDDI